MKDITVQLNGRRMDWLFAKGTRSVPVTRDNRCGSDNMMTQHPKTIRGAIPGERNTLLKFFLYTSPFLHCFSRPGAQEVERIAHQCWGRTLSLSPRRPFFCYRATVTRCSKISN